MTLLRRLLTAILALAAGAAAMAQDYPSRPVRIVVASGAGSGDDFATRVLADQLSRILKQPFLVENRPGAGGVIGQTAVQKAAPDGYTLLLAGGSMAGARFVNAAVAYDVLSDFTPISTIETAPFVLVANPALPAKDLKAFITHARANPGRITFGTTGTGQTPWWAAHLFNSMAGIQALEVPYKDFGSAMTDLIGGRLDYFVAPLAGAIGVRDKARLLAVTSDRSALLPDVPSIAEAGLPGYDMPAWRSIMGPAGLPPAVVATLNQAIQEALAAPDLRERYAKAGSRPLTGTPEELNKRYRDWLNIYERIARETGVKPQ